MNHRGRWVSVMGLLLLLVVLTPVMRADDEDEPTFLDKKLSYWMELLNDSKNASARKRGLVGVEQIGHYGSRKVVPALVKTMREDKDDEVRARAARAVGRTCAKALEQARSDKKEELPRFENARDALIVVLRTDKIDSVREASATALGDMGSDARGAVGALALALKYKHMGTVTAAATALRRMGKDAREAEPDMVALVANEKADLVARMEAAVALGQIRADVATSLPSLRTVLGNEKIDAKLRRAVAETFGKWGKEAADASATLGIVLIDRKGSPDELRLAAVTALSEFGPDAKAAVPALIKAVDDPDRVVRCLAMQTIGKMTEVLEDNRKPAIKSILKATEDSNIEVCVTSIETLGVLSASGLLDMKADVLKRLDEMLKREGRKAVREAAQAAKNKVDPPKKEKE